jgi:NADH-quinone oxidoreductase subunit A
MTALVFYLVVFVALGVFFLFIHLMIGKVVRPARPAPEKLTIYECGEPTVGSAWIQFDLRYYVVALLFVIFDVEVAFFFPWAVVFGTTNTLADPSLTEVERAATDSKLALGLPKVPGEGESFGELVSRRDRLLQRRNELQASMGQGKSAKEIQAVTSELAKLQERIDKEAPANRQVASEFSWLALVDILVFFGVLLVGFAYLWRRGDIDWVRSTRAERLAPDEAAAPDHVEAAEALASSGPAR